MDNKLDYLFDEIFAYLVRIEAKVDSVLDIMQSIDEEDYDDAELDPFGRERDNNETL